LDLVKEEPQVLPTFKEYWELFDQTYSKLNHKQATIDSYRSVLENHLLPVFGKIPLDEITRKGIKEFIITKQTVGLSPNTVRISRAYLSSILTQAVDDELIPINPAMGTGRYIKKVAPQKKVNPLTWAEKDLFEESVRIHFPRFYPFFLTALRTGMRKGELIALKPSDINFRDRYIEVKRNCVRGILGTPKSGKTRKVEMSDQLASALKGHLTKRKRDALKMGMGDSLEWLFYNQAGNMLDDAHLRNRVFNKALEKAKLRRIRIHDLRHTYATLRIQSGHNIADVSRQLGHHSIRITVDTYYHWMPGTNNQEVNELDLKSAPKRNLSATNTISHNEKGVSQYTITP
jgi:integrase